MKQLRPKINRRREGGIALVTALMISLATAMVLGASLAVVLTSNSLGWSQVRSETALQLADAGVNSELQYLSQNVAQVNITLKSSQPVAAVGVTLKYPGENYAVKGRQGTVPGFDGGVFWVYSSNDAAGTVAWDGVSTPYYITSSGYVNKTWSRIQVTCKSSSLFNLFASGSQGSYSGDTVGVVANPGAGVVINGPTTINGQVTTGTGATVTSPQVINANTCTYSSGQYTNTNVASGGKLVTKKTPYVYPTCANVYKQSCGHPEEDDDHAWARCKSSCNNSTGVYTYRSDANDDTIKSSNCQRATFSGNTLNNSCWNNAKTRPGTYDSNWWWWWNPTVSVQTLIFEPGDYYFSSVQLAYDASCEMVVDPQAFASGGTPGQVRFWVHDLAANHPTDDSIALPISNTCANGQAVDPGMFRIYCGKDNKECRFTRPNSCKDWQGNTISGDFEFKCGVYACTKQPNTVVNSSGACQQQADDSTKHGCKIHLYGCSTRSKGCAKITGSCLSDKMIFDGGCTLNFQASAYCDKDPSCGAQITGWCRK